MLNPPSKNDLHVEADEVVCVLAAKQATTAIMTAEMFARSAGIELTRIPYKGNGQAIGDLIGGHVSMMVLSLSPILGNVKTGKLFALAVTTPDRSKLLPGVPRLLNPPCQGFPPPSGMGLWRPPVRRRPSSSGCRANCMLR